MTGCLEPRWNRSRNVWRLCHYGWKVSSAKKEGWADEADKSISTIEQDQASIGMLLSWRVFIRHWFADLLLCPVTLT